MSLLVRLFVICSLAFCGLSFTGCTSGEEDSSVLEDELENLDSEEDGEFSDDEDLDEEGGDDLADIEDDELKDELDEDDESDEFGDDEVADGDEGEDFEKEFDDDDEQALAKELGEDQSDYPEGQDAQPTFPEEVIGDKGNEVQPVDPVAPAPQDGQYITSETKEMDVSGIPDPQVPQDDLGQADPLIPEEVENNKNQDWVPVVKIKADPFFRNEKLMNTVYVARPEDNLITVSQKIFGSDKSKELLDNNPHLGKGMDPGDKVYYSSPNRTEDKTTLKVYYDDIGLEPQKYVTNSGDNMRRLGSKLLGFPDGWKEVWAINPNIDSKTILPAGTEIRYWTGEESAAQTQAMAEEIPPEEPTPETQAQGTVDTEVAAPEEPIEPPPPSPVVAELPEEPPLPEATISEDEAMDPAMLSDTDIEPLPEDDLTEMPEAEEISAAGQTNGSSLIFTGALALLILGGAALVAIQIKNRKAQTAVTPPSLEYTQV